MHGFTQNGTIVSAVAPVKLAPIAGMPAICHARLTTMYSMVYTKTQARVQVEALVANFRANESSLADVPEAQIENN